MGLKEFSKFWNTSSCALQQSHHCGIESHRPSTMNGNAKAGSNRTIVGLKAHKSRKSATSSSQQSHHCGIERTSILLTSVEKISQQSHHCGIESNQRIQGNQGDPGSNRTIVGLKVPALACVSASLSVQQSHHCGIEGACDEGSAKPFFPLMRLRSMAVMRLEG